MLGNPGSGKTTELINLANYFKERITDLEITPIFISLSNIKKFNKIDDILPVNWNLSKKIILLLDALDEFEFKSNLVNEIKNLLQNNEISFKIIISCRNYAYNDELLVLNAQKFYLGGFSLSQSFELLNKDYYVSIEEYNQFDAVKFKDILEDPFMLNRLGIYFNNHKKIPETIFDIYNEIKSEISIKDIELYTIFALMLEMTQETSFLMDELKVLFGLNFKRLINLKFIQKSFDRKSFKFKHKNYQEYFAASALSELSIDEIKDFIVISGTDKTHPSLFNTIAFLLNILDSDKYNELVSWLIVNELELLFKADSDKTSNFKIQVFRDYFRIECIEKGFWINTNKTFSVLEIAQFGDCEENLKYLLDIVKETKDQPRVIISALNLLNFFTIPFNRKAEFKDLFIDFLSDLTIQNSIKSKIINCITTHKFCVEDEGYLNSIFKIFKVETSNEINSALLSLVMSLNDIDNLFWYLKEEFLRVNNIVKRDDLDKVHRGNSWVLEELILKIVDSNYFIELISYYFINEFSVNLNNTYLIKILERCLFFSSKENDFILRFLMSINGKTNYYFQDRLLIDIIVNSNSQYEASKYLLDNNDFPKVRMLLASVATTTSIKLVKDRFVQKLITSEEIEFYRNNLWHYNKVVSYEFDKLMLSIGFKFETPLLSDEELTNQQIQSNEKFQNNFDILFNKEELLKEIQTIFQENTAIIDQEAIGKIESNWYEKNGYRNYTISTSLKLMRKLVYHYNGELTFQKVQDLLENDFIRYDKIKTLIQGNVNSNIRFKVSNEQIADIIGWCTKISSEINFNEIIILYNPNSFKYDLDYKKLKTILAFQDEYEFELSQEFLLNCLEYFDIDKSSEEEDVFGKLLYRINDKTLFNKRIVDNILNKKMFSFVMDRHLSYALDHNLSLAFPKIRNYFKDNNPGYNLDEKLEKYIELTGDLALLKECCEDVKSLKCWSAIKILLKNKEADFCIAKAIEYLDIKLEDSNKFYLWDALGVLFQQNRKEAIVYYYSLLKEDRMSQMYYSNYSAVDYDTLEKLFFKTYGKDSEKSVFNDSGAFLSSYVSNLSKDDESYNKTKKVLFDIKAKLNKEDHDTELFYINILIDNSKTSYINSKSKPMNFEDALRKVEEIIN